MAHYQYSDDIDLIFIFLSTNKHNLKENHVQKFGRYVQRD